MSLEFVWEGEPPKHTPVEVVQESVESALKYFDDPRGIRSSIAVVHLGQDKFKHNVVGVGYSKDNERLVTFHYSLFEPKICMCAYCEE